MNNNIKAIRVAHIIVGLDVGGAESMLKKLILQQMNSSEAEHTVISLTTVGPIGQDLKRLGVNVISLNMSSLLQFITCFYKLRGILKDISPDVVQTWMYHSDLIGGVAAYSLGIRNIIWGVRSSDITKGGNKFTILIRFICAVLSHLIPKKVVYAANRSKEIHESLGYNKSKSQVIPNGFTPDFFNDSEVHQDDLRCEFNIPVESFVFGSVGRYNPVKDHACFIQAANYLFKSHKNVSFVLVGRGIDSSNLNLMKMINSTDCPENFILLGEMDNMPRIYKLFDVFCLHSKSEGFPNVLGEAMAAKKACITTNVGDADYLIGDKSLVVPKEDYIAFGKKMSEFASMDRCLLLSAGDKLSARIKSTFTMDVISQRYLNLYFSICY